jgi:hypothetical protein
LKVSAFAIEKVALDRRSACALKMHQQAILRRRKLSHRHAGALRRADRRLSNEQMLAENRPHSE